jgi:adenine-specific DNA-methyltransferase
MAEKKRPFLTYCGPVATTAVHALSLDPRLADLSRDELIQMLEVKGEGGIHIDFSGKDNARKLARRVRPRVSRTVKKYSVGSDEDQARNVLIEGDNLQAMATLFRERGQVDLIVTDPPYNTGHDWRYNDRWDDDPNDPGIGDWVSADDGARHTKWMRFMWPRLQMMKEMLKTTGVLAICIDYREMFRLGQMLDELFGEANRLGIINWQKSYAPRSDKGHVSSATEYVLVYAKDEENAKTGLLPRSEAMDARYQQRDGDLRLWKSGDASGPKAKTHQGMVFAIQSPFNGELYYPPTGSCWRDEQKQIFSWLAGWGCEYELKDLKDEKERARVIGIKPEEVPKIKGVVIKGSLAKARRAAEKVLERGPWPRIYFGITGKGRPQRKNYLEEVKQGKVPMTFWADEDFYDEPIALGSVSWTHDVSGHSQTGVNELDNIVGDAHGFETVKPLRLFERIIQIWCPDDGLVLDPFAGSGTTGNAVLDLNATLDTERRFILIEQGRPDRGDSFARALTADRLQRVITGDWKKGKHTPLGGGYRFWTLDKKVDADALLSMEREDLAETIIASHFDAQSRRRDALVNVPVDEGYKYLVAHNTDSEGFYLIWNGAKGNTDFTEDIYEAVAKEAKKAGLQSRYHVYARLYRFQTSNVVFYQIPDRILMDFGLDLRGEPYHDDDAS